jgi:O-antigen ligase
MSASIALARAGEIPSYPVAGLLKLFHAVLASPQLLFLVALSTMLFRPPDLKAFPIDRIAFALLVCVMAARGLLRRDGLKLYATTCPMLGLLLLGLGAVLNEPYNTQAWSVLAAKWIVPFVLFHFAGLVFTRGEDRRNLETFSLAVLCYLSLMAVFFLIGAKSFIFPRFILDEGMGIHAERARGPFLQAVANGVCLLTFAIVVLHSFERGRLRGVLAGILLVSTPLALLATKTRAVWLAAGVSILSIAFFIKGRARIVSVSLGLTAIAVLAAATLLQSNWDEWKQRFVDSSPVEFRLEMYRAGWQMFTEKPLFGWGGDTLVQPELERRVSGFRADYYIFHNTYLELAVQRGVIGLALYAWLIFTLFRLGAPGSNQEPTQFLGSGFGTMWRILLCAYLINASSVVMNYQFVNGYIFTIAGILAAQQRRDRLCARQMGERRHEDCIPLQQLS